MKTLTNKRRRVAALVAMVCAAAALLLASGARPSTAQGQRFSEYVDAKGNIALPADYQTKFIHLGSYAVASKEGGPADDLHNVYTRREDAAAFQKTGKFPDGAVLVKEVIATKSEKLTTGYAAWAAQTKVWFVMVKDAQGRFKNNPLWGEGWGWALFDAKNPQAQIAKDYRTDCRTCHVPAQKDDWLYVRGYSILHAKK